MFKAPPLALKSNPAREAYSITRFFLFVMTSKLFRLFPALLFVLTGVSHLSAQTEAPVKASLVSEQGTIAPGKAFRVAVKLEHQPTYHVYGKTVGDIGKPTRILWKLPEGWKAEDLAWPPTHATPSTDGAVVEGYDGTVHLPVQITPPAGLAAGSSVKMEGTVDALVCDPKSCRPIKLPFSLEVQVGDAPVADAASAAVFANLSAGASPLAPATPGAAAVTPSAAPVQSIGSLLWLAFLGGLILNIMPCVFPVLGIKITSLVQQAGDDRRKVLLHGLAYTLGVLVSFWILAAVLQALRVAGHDIAWGYQLQNPWFLFAIVLILTIFGLSMYGVFEFGTSAVGVGSDLTRRHDLSGSFFSGLLATVVATPCAAPALSTALTFAVGLPLWSSLAFFSVIALGLASPFLLLSAFPGLVKMLPRPGAWMESFKQAMAFLMLGAAAYFTWVLMALMEEENQRDLLIGLVIVAMACWIYGRWCLPHKPKSIRVKGALAALLALAFGLYWAHPSGKENTWQEWSPEVVEKLRSENKAVYIDFTARWCGTCQVNHRVYNDSSLAEEFKSKDVVMLKADWTNEDPRITKALSDLQKVAVPVNVLYVPGKSEPVVLPEILTVGNVKGALAELK